MQRAERFGGLSPTVTGGLQQMPFDRLAPNVQNKLAIGHASLSLEQ